MSPLAWPAVAPVLADEAVALRPWTGSDAGAVLAACQDPETQRWLDVPIPYLPEHAAEFVAEQSRLWESRRAAPFAIVTGDDGEIVGSCGLYGVDPRHLVAEVVYAVVPSARGRGVARRAAGLLCRWALRDLGLARLELYIEPANTASRAVAERLGCQYEGILRSKSLIQGTRRDMALYALLAEAPERD